MRYCFKITFDFPLHCIVEPLQQTNQNGMRTYIHVTMMCISLVQKTYAELCLPVHFSIFLARKVEFLGRNMALMRICGERIRITKETFRFEMTVLLNLTFFSGTLEKVISVPIKCYYKVVDL